MDFIVDLAGRVSKLLRKMIFKKERLRSQTGRSFYMHRTRTWKDAVKTAWGHRAGRKEIFSA